MKPLTKTRPQRYIYLSSVASTNDFLSEYCTKNNPRASLWVYTFDQKAGKGQFGRKWFSDAFKNISLSYFTSHKNLPVHRHFILNKSISLALIHFLKDTYPQLDFRIKWPNDIYINDRKAGGLLVQNQLRSKYIVSSIIGMGFNVNQDVFPPELPNPTSLLLESKKKSNLINTVFKLSQVFPSYLDHYINHNSQRDELYYRLLIGYKTIKSYRDSDGHEFKGRIEAVDDNGKLIISVEGTQKTFNHGELKLLIRAQ